MIASDHDRCAQLAAPHHLVEPQPEAVALAVAEPADPRREALVGDPFAGHLDPPGERRVVGELLEHGAVGRRDVGRVARQRDPPERSLALAEQRADVGGEEARVVERPVEAAEACLGTQAVAVVEDLAAAIEEPDHRPAVGGHALARPADQLVGRGARHLGGRLRGEVSGDVAERVVGARLVGHDVGREAEVEQLRDELGGVAEHTDRERPPIVAGSLAASDRILERVGALVEVGGLEAPFDAVGVDLDAQRDAVVHRDGQRLRPAHPAEAGGEGDRAGERAAEAAAGDLGEALVRALQDALRADVDPRAGGHLAVHREAERFEATELLPVPPFRDEVGVGDQHARRPLVGAEHADRLARLHEHRLVSGERRERAAHRVEGVPRPRRPAGAAVHDEIVGPFGDLRVEVVLQHAVGGLLRPAAAREVGAARGTHGSSASSHRVLHNNDSGHLTPHRAVRSLTRPLPARRRSASDPLPHRARATAIDPGPAPSTRSRSAPTAAPVPAAGSSGARRSIARAAHTNSTASTRRTLSTPRGACGRPTTPSTRGPPASRSSAASRRSPAPRGACSPSPSRPACSGRSSSPS